MEEAHLMTSMAASSSASSAPAEEVAGVMLLSFGLRLASFHCDSLLLLLLEVSEVRHDGGGVKRERGGGGGGARIKPHS
jgi:hypothetical protein